MTSLKWLSLFPGISELKQTDDSTIVPLLEQKIYATMGMDRNDFNIH